MEGNNIIFTTKGRYGKAYLILAIIAAVLAVIAAVITLFYLSFLLPIVGYFIGIRLARHIGRVKSFVELYDNHIIGLTLPKNLFLGIRGMRKFELSYADITHVEQSRDVVIIYAHGNKYKVSAKQCEQQVMDIIKQQQAIMQQQ